MLGRIEKYHHGRYAEIGRIWLSAPDSDGVFYVPDICPNCEFLGIHAYASDQGVCRNCQLKFKPDLQHPAVS